MRFHGRAHLDACARFPWDPGLCVFALVDFNLNLFIAVIWNHEYNSFSELCYRESLIESGLGTPNTSSHLVYFYKSTYNELSLPVFML